MHLAETPPPTDTVERLLTFVTPSKRQSLSFFHLFHPASLLLGCGETVLLLNLMGSTFILGVYFVLLMDCPSESLLLAHILPKAG